MRVSVIIPTLNEETTIRRTITKLQEQNPAPCEIIVVDGGSVDNTAQIASQFAAVRVLRTSACIPVQINFGAENASGDVLLFLHSDCELESGAIGEIITRLEDAAIAGGAFRYAIQDAQSTLDWLLMLCGSFNARISGMYLGDHGIFCRKTIFYEICGFPEVPIMYEFDFMKRLHNKGKVIQLRKQCYSSSRKFKQHGYLKIILLMRALRISYYLRLPSSRLQNLYLTLSAKR
ncbi:MAG TPA: TIGR04283 family arsenosugar biosynthesis glycosyltransferase [Acidobacteriota bacterium]|nr:TIGR04283 family arsenosugar biosynthesis glycosyltransferase [Acidobacteriota bacterium]